MNDTLNLLLILHHAAFWKHDNDKPLFTRTVLLYPHKYRPGDEEPTRCELYAEFWSLFNV